MGVPTSRASTIGTGVVAGAVVASALLRIASVVAATGSPSVVLDAGVGGLTDGPALYLPLRKLYAKLFAPCAIQLLGSQRRVLAQEIPLRIEMPGDLLLQLWLQPFPSHRGDHPGLVELLDAGARCGRSTARHGAARTPHNPRAPFLPLDPPFEVSQPNQ
jgi:hypothetical protein